MIDAKHVHETLARHQLADGYPIVMDLAKSHGAWLHDARTGEEYLDFFTCFASWPLGYNHPRFADGKYREDLVRAALTKTANSDIYTVEMAEFVELFATKATPQGYPYNFWISGGSLAVENALKAAFDWKARKIGLDKLKNDGADLVAMHFRHAFHGRSGYTMSLTNTDPTKTMLFPKFCWPRVHNPAIEVDLAGKIVNDIEAEERKALADIDKGFEQFAGRIACIIIEPMQGEGGDNHFRSEFLAKLRKICDEREALLVFDEVQTGFWGSGKPWLWQLKGVAPDIVAFGKKSQVCGIYSNKRIDEVKDNVFHLPSRINSTWGGNLVDMVRCRKFIEIIAEDDLGAHITRIGQKMIEGLRSIARDKGSISNIRGHGSLIALTLETTAARKKMLGDLMAKRVMALPSGERAIRFRLPLITSDKELEIALDRIEQCAPTSVTA